MNCYQDLFVEPFFSVATEAKVQIVWVCAAADLYDFDDDKVQTILTCVLQLL